MYRGIDISHHQGIIDFQAVKNSGEVDFVILKAGGSDDGFYKDSMFDEYLNGFQNVGIPVLGAYYFVGSGCTSYEDGVADGHRLCDILDGTGLKYAILDLESTSPDDRDGATQASIGFMETCISRGYETMVYASDISGFQEKLNLNELTNYKKWVARYNSSGPEYVGDYSIWQYTSSGTVTGINTSVDMDYLFDDDLISISDNTVDDNITWTREQATRVVNGLYERLLHRSYNEGENENLVSGLMHEMTRIEAFNSIRESDEYKKKQLIIDCYKFMRGCEPSDEELNAWLSDNDDNIKGNILYSQEFNNAYEV
jgi:GH25 family lysozyme M1 (1,4-beta-N-acetylmuramidase)